MKDEVSKITTLYTDLESENQKTISIQSSTQLKLNLSQKILKDIAIKNQNSAREYQEITNKQL